MQHQCTTKSLHHTLKYPLRKYFLEGYRIKNRSSLLRGQFSLRKHINGFNKDSFKVLTYYKQYCEDNGALFFPFPPHMAKTHTSKLRYRFRPRSGRAGLARAAPSAAPLEDQPPARCGHLVFLTIPFSLVSQSFCPRHHTLYRQPVIIRILFINLHRPRLNNHRFPELYLLPQIMIDKPIQ